MCFYETYNNMFLYKFNQDSINIKFNRIFLDLPLNRPFSRPINSYGPPHNLLLFERCCRNFDTFFVPTF